MLKNVINGFRVMIAYGGISFNLCVSESIVHKLFDELPKSEFRLIDENNYQQYHEEFIQSQPIVDQGKPIQPSQEESVDMGVYGLGSECSVGFSGASSSSSLVNQYEFELLHKKLADINELYLKEKAAREEEAKQRENEEKRMREEEEKRRKEDER
ncbi:hypothetical protein RND71_039499 [Anisodus tanguticus]|uniref:Uncharacterized protein n=1 Tax=Anisodus tanguticus TaxID=243964 RepID=A0AAE1QXI4_9SOLA|nr:hypothetical protein RND71_039499 [Anisodus tanguticus]